MAGATIRIRISLLPFDIPPGTKDTREQLARRHAVVRHGSATASTSGDCQRYRKSPTLLHFSDIAHQRFASSQIRVLTIAILMSHPPRLQPPGAFGFLARAVAR